MENEALTGAAEREEGPLPKSCPWEKREWIFLLSALLAAGCYFFSHFSPHFYENYHFPGIGLTLTQWLLTIVSLLYARKNGNLRWRRNPGGVFLLFIALGVGACLALCGDDAIRAMNLPVVILTTAAAVFSLTGINPLPALSGKGLLLALRLFLPSCFSHWLEPFYGLKSIIQRKKSKKLNELAVGFLCGVPVILIALLLLSSADQVFGAFLKRGMASAASVDVSLFIRLAFTLLLGLCLFSLLAATRFQPVEPTEKEAPSLSPVPLITILAMLAAVYAPFVYVQFRYLFLQSAPAMGYAEYARSGFFQLVILSMLTLGLILPFLSLGKKSKTLRALCALIALLTMIIDFSAFFRMRMYILSFGLSILRLVTLWGMLMILLALLGCVAKCAVPDLSICPALTALALSTWLMLNLLNPDRIVAANQVSAYNRGTISTFDTSYMTRLSPDVLPELEKLEDSALREKAIESAQEAYSRGYPRPYDWSLSCLNQSSIPDTK